MVSISQEITVADSCLRPITTHATIHDIATTHDYVTLPAVGSKGYIILDSAAEVCILSPKSVPFMSNVALAAGSTEPLVGLENVYGRSKTHAENSKNDGNDLSEDESDAVTSIRICRATNGNLR
jgi:hypothetical protein